jgi:DNA replication protein DnaC
MSSRPIAEPPHLAGDLKDLKLPAIAAHWQRLSAEAERKRQPYADYLSDLVHHEVLQRRENRIRRRIQDARFPVLKTLDAFDFAAQASLDRELVLDLFQCRFVEDHSNVVLIGGVGTGKTHLGIALAIACCQREYRVRFTTAAELTNALVEAKGEKRLSRKLEQMARYDVVCLDELGYVPFDKVGAELLFSFITKVYEKRSLIVTTNLPFARWTEVFLDATAAAAVIDRIVHHATVLKTEGSSFRLRSAKQEKGSRKKAARALEDAEAGRETS